MDIDTKSRLARINDSSVEAVAIRLRAAHKVTGYEKHGQLAEACGIKKTTLSNAMNAHNHPSIAVLSYLYRAHRIDFNFMMLGLFAQLPGDVQDALFPALQDATREWDQKENSNRNRAIPPAAQAQT